MTGLRSRPGRPVYLGWLAVTVLNKSHISSKHADHCLTADSGAIREGGRLKLSNPNSVTTSTHLVAHAPSGGFIGAPELARFLREKTSTVRHRYEFFDLDP